MATRLWLRNKEDMAFISMLSLSFDMFLSDLALSLYSLCNTIIWHIFGIFGLLLKLGYKNGKRHHRRDIIRAAYALQMHVIFECRYTLFRLVTDEFY